MSRLTHIVPEIGGKATASWWSGEDAEREICVIRNHYALAAFALSSRGLSDLQLLLFWVEMRRIDGTAHGFQLSRLPKAPTALRSLNVSTTPCNRCDTQLYSLKEKLQDRLHPSETALWIRAVTNLMMRL